MVRRVVRHVRRVSVVRCGARGGGVVSAHDGTPKYNTAKSAAVGVRFDHELLERGDRAIARLNARTDEPAWSRSDAIKIAFRRWVEAEEAKL